jgi:hypothetical protein
VRPGLDFFEKLSPEELEAYKAESIRRALEENAKQPQEKQRPEDAVREHEEWCFSLLGI